MGGSLFDVNCSNSPKYRLAALLVNVKLGVLQHVWTGQKDDLWKWKVLKWNLARMEIRRRAGGSARATSCVSPPVAPCTI